MAAHPRHEAVFLLENRELKALSGVDLILLDRPVVTLARDVSDFSVRPTEQDRTPAFEMVVVSGPALEAYRDGHPIQRIPLPKVTGRPDSVQVRHSADGRIVAASYCADDRAGERHVSKRLHDESGARSPSGHGLRQPSGALAVVESRPQPRIDPSDTATSDPWVNDRSKQEPLTRGGSERRLEVTGRGGRPTAC